MKIDSFVLALLVTVGIAFAWPCQGVAASVANGAAEAAIVVLFFLYGARLSRESIARGISNVRLQLAVGLVTFALFPVLGLALAWALGRSMPASLVAGLVFLTVLPSTVQSSIAFTSIARGNVPAAICAASLSNVAGVVVTPALVGLFLKSGDGEASLASNLGTIALHLLLPFAVGHALRGLIGGWLARRGAWTSYVDRGSILLVVYVAFSEGVVTGVWRGAPVASLIVLGVVCSALLAVVMVASSAISRGLGLSTEDEIVLVFCGSKKSLASGLPMAKILFAGPEVSLLLLPLMLFHQIQLMVCAVVAGRYARRRSVERPALARVPLAHREEPGTVLTPAHGHSSLRRCSTVPRLPVFTCPQRPTFVSERPT